MVICCWGGFFGCYLMKKPLTNWEGRGKRVGCRWLGRPDVWSTGGERLGAGLFFFAPGFWEVKPRTRGMMTSPRILREVVIFRFFFFSGGVDSECEM